MKSHTIAPSAADPNLCDGCSNPIYRPDPRLPETFKHLRLRKPARNSITGVRTSPRLTPHQATVLADLHRLSARKSDGWVRHTDIGAAGAMQHLVDKGYAERRVVLGQRGGQHPWFRPL